jgi:transposase
MKLHRPTACHWIGQRPGCSGRPVETIRRRVFAADKIHADDTTVPALSPGLGWMESGRRRER